MKPNSLVAFFFLCFFSYSLFAQSPKAIEADLYKSFKKFEYWNQYGLDNRGNGDKVVAASDSLAKCNDIFAAKLKKYTQQYLFTITCPFTKLKNEQITITTSNDSLFRIYSWDTWLGGTMHSFENVLQYKDGNKLFSILDTAKSEKEYIYRYSELYSVKVANKTFYLAHYDGIFSNKDIGEGIRVFTIENGKLINGNLIKTNSGMHFKLYYNYDFFSVVDWKTKPYINFDPVTKIIKLPLVVGNGQVTHKFIRYKFTGQYFELVKN